MTEYVQVLIIANMYRVLCLAAGVMFGYFGYRLFRVGVYEKAGELKAAFGDKHLVLKQVGPGVFFALFGVFIVVIGGLRTLTVERTPVVRPDSILEAKPSQSPADKSNSPSQPLKPAEGPSARLKQGGPGTVSKDGQEFCAVDIPNGPPAADNLKLKCTPYPGIKETTGKTVSK